MIVTYRPGRRDSEVGCAGSNRAGGGDYEGGINVPTRHESQRYSAARAEGRLHHG